MLPITDEKSESEAENILLPGKNSRSSSMIRKAIKHEEQIKDEEMADAPDINRPAELNASSRADDAINNSPIMSALGKRKRAKNERSRGNPVRSLSGLSSATPLPNAAVQDPSYYSPPGNGRDDFHLHAPGGEAFQHHILSSGQQSSYPTNYHVNMSQVRSFPDTMYSPSAIDEGFIDDIMSKGSEQLQYPLETQSQHDIERGDLYRYPTSEAFAPLEPIYRARTPLAASQEPIYRTRSTLPTTADEIVYDRPSPSHQQEYYHVEPRPQYTETFEYVRVSDPQGDYMIRRAVRQPIHAARYEYDDRQSISETHGSLVAPIKGVASYHSPAIGALGASFKDAASPSPPPAAMESDDEDEEYKPRSTITRNSESIISTYEGFKAHVRRLNPEMEPRYNWLVARIAHQQEIRYKTLLEKKVKHSQSILDGNCAAGDLCLALEGNPAIVDEKIPSLKGTLQLKTNFSEAVETDEPYVAGSISQESFPFGLPVPPADILPAEFECQLCYKTFECVNISGWIKHIHEDVRPYTCTYDKCKEPRPFRRKADWERHENERHRHLEWWVCQFDDCRRPCYRKANFLQHLVREHKVPEPNQLKKRDKSNESVWDMMEKSHHKTMNRPQDEACKFCSQTFPSWEKLRDHLANHLEHISLPIIQVVRTKNVNASTIVSPVEQRLTSDQQRSTNDSTHPHLRPESFWNDRQSGRSGEAWEYPILEGPDNFYFSRAKEDLPLIPLEFVRSTIAFKAATHISRGPGSERGWQILKPRIEKEWELEALREDYQDEKTLNLHARRERRDRRVETPEWDVQSLASVNTFRDSAIGSSLPSNVSGSLIQELPKTAQEEILLILFSDQQFRSLLESATSLMNKPRFTRNVRRLIVSFERELEKAAEDHREKDVTKIIEKHSQWFADRLFQMSDPENKSNVQNMAQHLNQHIDKRPMLERYLASTMLSTQPENSQTKTFEAPSPLRDPVKDKNREAIQNYTQDSSDESEANDTDAEVENYINYSRFPNLEHIKNFIIGGTAFENLQNKTSQFLNPKKLSEPPTKVSTEKISEESFQGSGSTETTEITVPDIELEDNSDDSASIASDDPALAEQSDLRILNPREYFGKLEALEQEIFNDSAFLFPRDSVAVSNFNEAGLLWPASDDYNFQTKIETEFVVRMVKFSTSSRLLHLLECYNIIRRTGKSLNRLRDTGYCSDHITLLVMDQYPSRRRVANAVQIPIFKIFDLGSTFESTLQDLVAEISLLQIGQVTGDTIDSMVERQEGNHCLTAKCEEILITMGLVRDTLTNEGTNCPIIWDSAVQLLQLGVLSYAGAHIQRFDLDLVGSEITSLQLPVKIHYENGVLRMISSRPRHPVVTLRRRQLQCLDKFLGGCQPWVFHQEYHGQGVEPLHLSTSIESLTDLWGPSWKVLKTPELAFIQQYDIGNGSIVPWPENVGYASTHSAILPTEVYCHWISSKEWNEPIVKENQMGLVRKHLLDSDTLLIGADTGFGLNVNLECSSSLDRLSSLKTQLHEQGALRIPRTFRARRYVDSQAVQVSGSALGIVSGTGIITYKRRVGHTMKDALVERWRHNLRSPLDLEAFSGVEVSFCTRNARRRRLMHLLSSHTMRNYLHTISFNWVSEACEHAYFKALRCPKSFRSFWKGHKEWQENVGDAVSICLDALEETGIKESSGELSALWIESFDAAGDSDGEASDEEDDKTSAGQAPVLTTLADATGCTFCEEHIVTLFRSEHTWTGFLQDSEESLTMAIVGMICLDFNHENGYGRRCAGQRAITKDASKSKGFAVLQTSLKINQSLLKNEKLKPEKLDNRRKTIWDAKDLKRGTSFVIGNHGTLKVLTGSTRTCPVIAEWSAVKSALVKEVKNVAINEKLLGRPAEGHHCEYIRGSWEAKPLPVLVMSKSTKIIFSKE